MNVHPYVLTQALLSSSSILSLSERHVKQCGAAAAVGALMCWVQNGMARCFALALQAICRATGRLLRSQNANCGWSIGPSMIPPPCASAEASPRRVCRLSLSQQC